MMLLMMMMMRMIWCELQQRYDEMSEEEEIRAIGTETRAEAVRMSDSNAVKSTRER